MQHLYHTPLTVQYIKIRVSIKPHALVSNRMLVSMNTLVLTPKYFLYHGVNVGNIAVTHKRPHRKRANMCHFVSYIMLFQKIIVYKILPLGEGVGSIACPWFKHSRLRDIV